MDAMADLIAIGYPDETTAFAAADEARQLAADLIIQPDAIAVIARDKDGSYHVTKTSIDRQFQDQVRDMVQPGTSALFLMLEKVTPDKAVEAMSKYGGTVLKTSLSKDDEKELQDALHGPQADTQ
jgi:uncharacterized membrane protein